MSKRGGEEAELHQMKWGESNSSINQAGAKGRVYCVFCPLSRCGTERQGVNEAAYSGQQSSTTGSQHQTMSDSNAIAASTTDQVSPNCHLVFLVCFRPPRFSAGPAALCCYSLLAAAEASCGKSLKWNFAECRKRNRVLDTQLSLDAKTEVHRECFQKLMSKCVFFGLSKQWLLCLELPGQRYRVLKELNSSRRAIVYAALFFGDHSGDLWRLNTPRTT